MAEEKKEGVLVKVKNSKVTKIGLKAFSYVAAVGAGVLGTLFVSKKLCAKE